MRNRKQRVFVIYTQLTIIFLAMVFAVLTGYEKPADQSITVKNKRTQYGQTYYSKYAKTGKCTGVGVFTIVEVATGEGSTNGWGKLKSGAFGYFGNHERIHPSGT